MNREYLFRRYHDDEEEIHTMLVTSLLKLLKRQPSSKSIQQTQNQDVQRHDDIFQENTHSPYSASLAIEVKELSFEEFLKKDIG